MLKVELDRVSAQRFTDALRLYAKARRDKDYAYIVNRAARNVAMWAANKTKVADAAKLAWQLGATMSTTIARNTKKNGWTRSKKPKAKLEWQDDFKSSLAARIVNARLKKKGSDLVWGKELKDKAKRLIMARRRSVGFTKSGWLPAIRDISKAIRDMKGMQPQSDASIRGADKGYGLPATKGTVGPVAEIGNNAKGAGTTSAQALTEAMNYVAKDMEEFAMNLLKKSAKEAGFEVR